MKLESLTPREIVARLDRHIVGQAAAKKAVAIALRNRWRRQQLPPELRDEVAPKNILLIGPTGVGKTEIARRLAALARAPFLKVEASRYTEVGYHGRDVESMVRDLVKLAVNLVEREEAEQNAARAEKNAEERLLDALLPRPERGGGGGGGAVTVEEEAPVAPAAPAAEIARTPSGAIPLAAGEALPAGAEGGGNTREKFRRLLRAGQLDAAEVELELSVSAEPLAQVFSTMGAEEMGAELEEAFARMMPRRTRRRRLTVAEARRVLLAEETEKLLDREKVTREAVERAENLGIIFIDELDKIVGGAREAWGPDVSREGVQRDLLPIVEGTTVVTRYGNVRTEHILFIAAGAFHAHKPSDLIPELQGRFPIRVELSALKEADLLRILKEPENSLLKQYQALLATEGVELAFEERAVKRMAEYAALANSRAEDIGARRLHTIVEKVLGELSFNAPDLKGREKKVRITEKYVAERLAGILADQDLAKYIL